MDLKSLGDLLENKVLLNEDAIQALCEFAGVGLLNLNIPTGEISLNRTIAQLTGYEPGEIPHTVNTKEMLTFEDDRPKVKKCVDDIMAGKTDRYHIEYRMRRRDGSIVSVEEYAFVYERDSAGSPVSFAALSLDLSRLRWAEDKARRMELENKRLGNKVTDTELAEQNRLLRAANAAATMIIGGFHQDYETVLTQSLQTLGESIQADRAYIWRNFNKDNRKHCFLRSAWARENYPLDQNLKQTTSYDDFVPGWQNKLHERASICMLASELPAKTRKVLGDDRERSIMIAPLYLQGEFWGLLVFEDFSRTSPFSADECEIMVSGANVIASSISRNETFSKLNEAREEAMASTKAKGEFLSRMSHEIRTPMNAIIGMTTIARKAEDPARIKYCLDKVDASSRQLLSLINDVLDMSKIDSGKFEMIPEEFDFETLLTNVLNVVQIKFGEKNQNFRIDFNKAFDRYVVGDELRISQVLINLLNNASKFTADGGNITLHISETPLSDGRSTLHVCVEDDGIGISPEKQKKLFRSFEQADGSITRAYGGTGLGLAICKKIVDMMEGNIRVESVPGEGSKFSFDIKIGWGKPLLSEYKKPENLRILVVDDDKDVLDYFKAVLSDFSLDCDIADSGESAIEAAGRSIKENRPYDIMFIDWFMPGLNGGETAKKIRENVKNSGVVVMISAADWADIEEEAKAFGLSNFLPKPVLPGALYSIIIKLTDAKSPYPKTAETAKYDWAGKSILLAEDIEINREIVHSILSDTGVSIVNAADGEQAVSLFKNSAKPFDLVLMDVQMPNLDGLGATRQIRKLDIPGAATVPIFAMTANAFKEDAQMCLDAGMNGHLSKPLDLDVLFDTLSKYLDK